AALSLHDALPVSGEYRVAVTSIGGPVTVRASYVAELPLLAAEDAGEGETVGYVITTRAVSREAFALTVESDEYRPMGEEGDILHIDPDEPPEDGDLPMVRRGADPPALCRGYMRARRGCVHPVTGKPRAAYTDPRGAGVRLLGRVVGLQSSF